MKVKLLLGGLLLTGAAVAMAATDPVLMTVNGKDVKLSEFEYLYKKNNQQQEEPETLDQYVDRFVTYKLKVADAIAMGLDTLPDIKREIDGYRADIIAPYLNDTTVNEQLAREAYARMLRDIDVSHFMISRGRDYAADKKQMAKMDSLRNLIVDGKLDFNAAADQYSIDRSVVNNHGEYGFITAGLFPYEFDKVAYETPIGQVSKPFMTEYGVHLIRVNGERPDDGTVECEHILILFPRGNELTEEKKAEAKQRIDSIYNAILAGADFNEMATKFSQDPGSAKKGGRLSPFGRSRMVKQFEDVAFSLQPGQMSEPFETPYGYHIVRVIDKKGVPSYEEARQTIYNQMAMDERADAGKRAMVEKLKTEYKAKVNPKLQKELLTLLGNNGGYNTQFIDNALIASNITAFTYTRDKKNVKVPVSKLVPYCNRTAKLNNESAAGYIASLVDALEADQLLAIYSEDIINNNPEYKNLLNEYYEGSLYYEVSRRKVFDAHKHDYEGLNNYFLAHKEKYDFWETPHFKGVIIYAANDSVADRAKEIKATMIGQPVDSIATRIHKELGKHVVMERLTVDQRENSNIDHLVFQGAETPSRKGDKYPVYFILDGRIINHPEEARDIVGDSRAPIVSDYQNYLEEKWNKELREKYPVVINREVLKQVKPIARK